MSDNQKTNDCRKAEECSRKDCKFVHPEGWEPKVVECRKGLECNRSKCIFEHPEGWAPIVVQCRNDLQCGRSRCIFEHSEGWNWRNNASGDAEEQPRRSNRFEKRPQTMGGRGDRTDRGDRPVRSERGDRADSGDFIEYCPHSHGFCRRQFECRRQRRHRARPLLPGQTGLAGAGGNAPGFPSRNWKRFPNLDFMVAYATSHARAASSIRRGSGTAGGNEPHAFLIKQPPSL